MIDTETAFKIADRMVKPWQWATLVLSLTVIGLLTTILLSYTDVESSIKASDITAKSLATDTNIVER